jgi:hypothetical protein
LPFLNSLPFLVDLGKVLAKRSSLNLNLRIYKIARSPKNIAIVLTIAIHKRTLSEARAEEKLK